jgi:Uma2 family endonuclease
MNAPLRKPMTLEEFLAWEEHQELKYEFDGFGPVAMAGGTLAHAVIQRNLAIAVGGRLLDKPRNFVGSDFKIEVAGSVRYPDAMVYCTPVPPDAKLIRDPVVIFEVLSPSTAAKDQFVKGPEYQATSSVQRYVMLAQDRVAATVFSRENGDWIGRFLGEDGTLAMPEIGIAVPLVELYTGLDLSQPLAEEDA